MPDSEAVIREVYERWNSSGTPGGLALELFSPDVEVRQHGALMDSAGTFHGHQGLVRSAEELMEAFERVEWLPERWEREGDWMLVTLRVVCVGAHSGVETDVRVAHAWRVVDGLITDFYVYTDETEAREALGAGQRERE